MEICVENKSVRKLLPVLFAFFVMGFVDVVGISTSYVKNDFGLNDTLANLLPMMVFFMVCRMLFTDRSVNGAYRAEEDCIAECFDYGNCDVVTIYLLFIRVGIDGIRFTRHREYDFTSLVESASIRCCIER